MKVLHSYMAGSHEIVVVQGSRGANPKLDIVVRYYDRRITYKSMPRSVPHTLWVVDILIKKAAEKKRVGEFIDFFCWEYASASAFKSIAKRRDYLISLEKDEYKLERKFKALSNIGEFNIKFLRILLGLLARVEKTHSKKAHKFNEILFAITHEENLWDIMSRAGYRGKKG